MSDVVLALDVGGSAVKATLASFVDGATTSVSVALPTLRPDAVTAELEPSVWWDAVCRACTEVVSRSGGSRVVAVVPSSLRQGLVLVDGDRELGRGILNSDRRGADQLDGLVRRVGRERLYATTGHWPAPELTLPKLMHLGVHEPDRLAAAERLLLVHDWLVWRLTGVRLTEGTLASSGQLLDVAARDWAHELLAEVGVPRRLLPALRTTGDVAGHVLPGAHGLAAGTPVLVGGGDTMLAALGAGALGAGDVTVVAGSSTPVQAALDAPPADPLRRPWVSTHLRAGTWAAETNCGYPGGMLAWFAGTLGLPVADVLDLAWSAEPGAGGVTAVTATAVWDEAHWARRAPNALHGFTPATTPAQLARAHLEAHAFAVRANVEDLERATGRAARRVVLTGGATADPRFAGLVADVLGRTVHDAGPQTAGRAALAIASGDLAPGPGPGGRRVVPAAGDDYAEAYGRFLAVTGATHEEVPA